MFHSCCSGYVLSHATGATLQHLHTVLPLRKLYTEQAFVLVSMNILKLS